VKRKLPKDEEVEIPEKGSVAKLEVWAWLLVMSQDVTLDWARQPE
jgi:hypothetical protein